jgi:hypothetical protein
MKTVLAIFCLVLCLSPGAKAQQAAAQLLKEPAAWEFERFVDPLVLTELRYSPGMFSNDAPDYFTHAMAVKADSTPSFLPNDISEYLRNYFKAICSAANDDRKLSIDTSKITVTIEKKKGIPASESIYNIVLHIFSAFGDGRPVTLLAECKVLTNKAAQRTYAVFIFSRLAKTDAIWKDLYKIQKDFSPL